MMDRPLSTIQPGMVDRVSGVFKDYPSSYHTQASVVRDQNERLERELAELRADKAGLEACLQVAASEVEHDGRLPSDTVEESAVALGTRAMMLVSSGQRVLEDRLREVEKNTNRMGDERRRTAEKLISLEGSLELVEAEVTQLREQLASRDKEAQALDALLLREHRHFDQKAREAKALARSADEEARRIERTVATQEEQVVELKRKLQHADDELVNARAEAVGNQAVLGQLRVKQESLDNHLANSVSKLENEERKYYRKALEDARPISDRARAYDPYIARVSASPSTDRRPSSR